MSDLQEQEDRDADRLTGQIATDLVDDLIIGAAGRRLAGDYDVEDNEGLPNEPIVVLVRKSDGKRFRVDVEVFVYALHEQRLTGY